MKNKRENFLISGMFLIVLGAVFSLGVDVMMGAIMGLSGVICFVLGMSIQSNLEMSPEAIADWLPSMEQLPDAGRFMFRVDVTLDDPIKSSILCGPCGHIELVPAEYDCTKCGRRLWNAAEEE